MELCKTDAYIIARLFDRGAALIERTATSTREYNQVRMMRKMSKKICRKLDKAHDLPRNQGQTVGQAKPKQASPSGGGLADAVRPVVRPKLPPVRVIVAPFP